MSPFKINLKLLNKLKNFELGSQSLPGTEDEQGTGLGLIITKELKPTRTIRAAMIPPTKGCQLLEDWVFKINISYVYLKRC